MSAELSYSSQLTIDNEAVRIDWAPGMQSCLPHLWLRDNCHCNECRIEQTSEKRFILSDVTANLTPAKVELVDDVLFVEWPDGHQTRFDGRTLRAIGTQDSPEIRFWSAEFVPHSLDYDSFLNDDKAAIAGIDAFLAAGAIILTKAPTERGTLESLAQRLGPIREVLFDRIHDVAVDPAGYNVAHTALPLPPHNDFASYTWPPSVQALHMLENEAPGGRSIIVDGWSLLNALREERPAMFEILCRVPVPFREFDDNNETYAVEPLVRCDTDGNVTGFRFSNQLMQTMNPNQPACAEFYRAYHELCCRVGDVQRHARFRLRGGDILIVAAHRVLHGREAFEPVGRRHLQDAYFEFDNVRNMRTVLLRREVPEND